MIFERLECFFEFFYQRCTRGSTMKRNISRDQRLTDRGRNPKEKSSFSIDVKGGEKNRGMEEKRHEDRGSQHMKTGGANMSMSVSIVVSKCFHQCQRGRLLKD
jgi:hypothetical protein